MFESSARSCRTCKSRSNVVSRLIDFGSFISVEGGLIYETLPAEEWRDKLQALGLEVDR